MKIAVANDHGGLNLKRALLKYFDEKGVEYINLGTDTAESVDYPEYALKAAETVASGGADYGIVICGTGIGVSIVANKVPGIRCGHCHDTFSAKMTRMHNDANMLAFGERVIGEGLMIEIVEAFLGADFLGGRHQRRVDKIKAIEEKYLK